GSYTGLRVGLATAKGLCYALDRPLILLSTLQVMAAAAISHCTEHHADMAQDLLYCPMIDARRMEVFTAVYDGQLNAVMPPSAMILDEQSFRVIVKQHRVVFSGNGAGKFRNIMNESNAIFCDVQHDASSMQAIAEHHYLLKSFADKAYSEPFYIKEFFSTASKLKSD
ncbi:MAG TPA: tRNA (adenosine(37)-N6)-threonylcarbamoyltransferase complex dimerization subunit type 1 TsaB, partial [Chitinophagaceae bacterium]